MEGDEKPRYVSRDMNEAWERAQTSQEEEKSERDRKRSRARLHTVIYGEHLTQISPSQSNFNRFNTDFVFLRLLFSHFYIDRHGY